MSERLLSPMVLSGSIASMARYPRLPWAGRARPDLRSTQWPTASPTPTSGRDDGRRFRPPRRSSSRVRRDWTGSTASFRHAIAKVESIVVASCNRGMASSSCPASESRRACEYLRSASSDDVVTCSSGSSARMVTSDSPIRSRSAREQTVDRWNQLRIARSGLPERGQRRSVGCRDHLRRGMT